MKTLPKITVTTFLVLLLFCILVLLLRLDIVLRIERVIEKTGILSQMNEKVILLFSQQKVSAAELMSPLPDQKADLGEVDMDKNPFYNNTLTSSVANVTKGIQDQESSGSTHPLNIQASVTENESTIYYMYLFEKKKMITVEVRRQFFTVRKIKSTDKSIQETPHS